MTKEFSDWNPIALPNNIDELEHLLYMEEKYGDPKNVVRMRKYLKHLQQKEEK